MFVLHTRLHRLIYPRCHDGLSGLSKLNLCAEEGSVQGNQKIFHMHHCHSKWCRKIAWSDSWKKQSTKQQTNAKNYSFFIRYLIAASLIRLTWPFHLIRNQRSTNSNKNDITIGQPPIDCIQTRLLSEFHSWW